MSLPAEITDSGNPEEVQIGKIAAFLPHRRNAQMAFFELSTPCMEDWDLYSELFLSIVNTLEPIDGGSRAADSHARQPQSASPGRRTP
ncbi:hypothetical protein SUDANB6_01514 [Streptomyces sp. enrichment culture]|uniref:hypothetical protein n=1 Tax=Streptomyces sp. enrichment culture TaxID=1795815 RepID=UPI003F563D08